jgi:hypothetical protein
MKLTVHLKSGKVFVNTDVEILEDLTRLVITYRTGAYSVIPLVSLDWYDVEYAE